MQIDLKTLLLACLAAAALPAVAQSTTPPGLTLQADTQLVVVDVVVQDKSGNPVRGLKPEAFQITDSNSPQTLRHFEEHTSLAPKTPGPTLPKLPPGTFTDYTPVPPNGTLNILLLDALNTPVKDQAYVRFQLQEYVRHADPGTRIAIFGLANRLVLLQGFTSDPATLKDIIDHKLIPRPSSLLDGPADSDDSNDLLADSSPSMAQISANLQQFQAEQQYLQIRLRTQYTLDAFNSLAHYLAAFPGRKNLIWFSGAFPLSVLPDPTLPDPFAISQIDPEEFRETSNLLAKSQVAVYPVDARGLMTQPMLDASNSGRKYARSPSAFAADASAFSTSQAQEHFTMEQMATDTGGHAFYNTNGLAQAVSQAIASGSNYYTLTYSPTAHPHDGSYREVRIRLAPEAAPANTQLSYRHGYYAYADTANRKKPDILAAAPTATTPSQPTTSVHTGTAYARAAMTRGAPTPQDLLFKVQVLPASTATETALAPGNVTDPQNPLKPPFQRLNVDYAALPAEFALALQPDGRRTGELEFLINLYDVDGRLLNAAGRGYKLNLDPATYKSFLSGAIQAHFEVSVPAHTETYLRIGIHDISSDRFGVVEFPASTVSRLPPAPKSAPPPPPATPSPKLPVPSTPAPPTTPPPS